MSDVFTRDMSNAHAPQPAEAAESTPWLLTQARESAGLHMGALAAALKVPVKKLEALEAGRYEELPDLTFARGLASSACRHLRVDPGPVLEQIPQAVTPQLGDSDLTINAPFKPVSMYSPAHAAGWLSRPAVLGAMALLLGALVLVFFPDMALSPSAVNQPSTSTSTSVTAVPLPDMTTTPELPGSAAPQGAGPVTTTGAEEAPANSSPSLVPVIPTVALPDAPGSTATGLTGEPGSELLRIRAKDDSWVQVTDASRTVVFQRLLRRGDEVGFGAAPPYAVLLGRVDAAEVIVRGQPFDATPFARNSVARFEVK